MSAASFLLETDNQGRQLTKGIVVAMDEVIVVDVDGRPMACELLQTCEGPGLQLAPGDGVLVWQQNDDDECGIILGRVGPSSRPATPALTSETPDELVLEAKQQLTFRCGEGSITLRADGKVLIKGKDLVSHAQRSNRIKGGSVAIN